jgi:iron-sulfur cluster repair protein YtfE (RIC family)
MSDFEITALVLAEHEVFRRAFTGLDDLTGADLAGAWEELEAKLEVHAVAEEELFYPLLAQEADAEQETAEGVHDHNEIRHAVAAVADHEVGSDAWWAAVHTARQVNADHMAEEETDFFPPFTQAVDDEQREALGMRWLAFHDEHERAAGLSGADAEVAEVVATQVPEGDPSVDGT